MLKRWRQNIHKMCTHDCWKMLCIWILILKWFTMVQNNIGILLSRRDNEVEDEARRKRERLKLIVERTCLYVFDLFRDLLGLKNWLWSYFWVPLLCWLVFLMRWPLYPLSPWQGWISSIDHSGEEHRDLWTLSHHQSAEDVSWRRSLVLIWGRGHWGGYVIRGGRCVHAQRSGRQGDERLPLSDRGDPKIRASLCDYH